MGQSPVCAGPQAASDMERFDKTVFISYRRLATPWAHAILYALERHGYDVFIDFKIASGDFEEAIFANIKARAHFLPLLTPTALGRCGDPADLFRREIDTAIAERRNIVPIMLDDFDFSSPGIDGQLWDTLATLKRYNGLKVPPDMLFSAAMQLLRDKYLNVQIDTVLHPASDSARNTANEAKKSVGAYMPGQSRDPTQQPNRTRAAAPYSFLRVSASANTVCARHEGATELMGDVFLRCTYDDDRPSPGPMLVTVELSASAPITSRILDRNVTDVVLFEVGRPGAATLIPGVNLGGPGAYGITFSKVHLGDIGPRETRIFQISNLRCDCGCVPVGPAATGSPVFVYVTMTGAPIEDAQQIVATVKRGIEFEARSADNSGRLADSGFETSRSADLVEQRIATLRFTEGFVNAFKSRAPTHGPIWDTHEWNSVSNGESGSRCAVFEAGEGAVQVAGLADFGTELQAAFSNLPAGVRIFVSAHQLGYRGYGGHARLLVPGGEATVIGDVEARELPIRNGTAMAIWEVRTPFYSERSAGFFDFAVFASYVSDPVANVPFVGTSILEGGLSPQLAAYSSTGPIPMFISTLAGRRCNFLTVVP